MKTKICSKCKIKKDLDSFRFVNGKKHQGYYCFCRPCEKEDGKRYYLQNKENINLKNRLNRDKKIDYYREYEQNRRPERKHLTRIYKKKWKENNREKVRANSMVSSAIESGKLKREPCRDCQSTINIQAHHPDYSKPLKVVWFCPVHHKAEHKRLKQIYG